MTLPIYRNNNNWFSAHSDGPDSSKSSKRKKVETARDIYDKEIDSKRQKMIKKGTEGRKKRWMI